MILSILAVFINAQCQFDFYASDCVDYFYTLSDGVCLGYGSGAERWTENSAGGTDFAEFSNEECTGSPTTTDTVGIAPYSKQGLAEFFGFEGAYDTCIDAEGWDFGPFKFDGEGPVETPKMIVRCPGLSPATVIAASPLMALLAVLGVIFFSF